MQVAKVIGNIWATRKEEKLAGLKLLLVQPINPLTGELYRIPIVAAGSSARSAAGDMKTPVDATVVGIVDDQDVDASVLQQA